MQWSRAKSILIVVFVLLNAYLLTVYLNSMDSDRYIDKTVISDALTIIKENNVIIDESVIPGEISDVQTFDVSNSCKSSEDLFKIFLDEGYFRDEQGFYADDSKSFWLNGINFDVNIDAPSTELYGVSFDQSAFSEEYCAEYADSLLTHFNMNSDDVRVYKKQKIDDMYIITFRRSCNDCQVVDSSIAFSISQQGLNKIEARNWLGDTLDRGLKVQTRQAIEALIGFSADIAETGKSTTVTGVALGYYIGERKLEESVVTTTPVWIITTADDKEYIYDARNNTRIQ